MTPEAFYDEVARLLETTHEYRDPLPIRSHVRYDGTVRNTFKNRWNGREPGNGRFPGHGIARHFGAVIQVALTDPPLYGVYASADDAINAIWCAVGEKLTRDLDARISAALDERPPKWGPDHWEKRRAEKQRTKNEENI